MTTGDTTEIISSREGRPAPHMLTEVELAERWRCSRGWLTNMRSSGVGPRYVRLGRAVRYRLDDVEEFERAGVVQ